MIKQINNTSRGVVIGIAISTFGLGCAWVFGHITVLGWAVRLVRVPQ